MATQPSELAERPLKSLARWTGFIHLLSYLYMNYRAAVIRAGKRKTHRAVDIDVHLSSENTLWALHWGTVGQNHLHDPLGKIGSHVMIKNLSDEQISRLRGPNGQHPHKLVYLLDLAHARNVRVEVELKVIVPIEVLAELLGREKTADMKKHGKLQFKTLASIPGCIHRLQPAHQAGGTTILSFTGYRGEGISKSRAWPVTDYTRGTPKWVA